MFTCIVSRATRGPRERMDRKDIQLVVPVIVISSITGFPNRVIRARRVYLGNKGLKETRWAWHSINYIIIILTILPLPHRVQQETKVPLAQLDVPLVPYTSHVYTSITCSCFVTGREREERSDRPSWTPGTQGAFPCDLIVTFINILIHVRRDIKGSTGK